MKVLLVGDSFAADWAVKNPGNLGWPNLLAKRVSLDNLAQAGVSQYRILQQIQRACLDDFDWIIICNTSPQRIVTREHPIHADILHASADLIFADLEYHQQQLGTKENRSLTCAYDFFRYHYDEDFQNFVYKAVLNEISQIVKHRQCIVIGTPLVPRDVPADIVIDDKDMQKCAPNHLSTNGNLKVYHLICNVIYA